MSKLKTLDLMFLLDYVNYVICSMLMMGSFLSHHRYGQRGSGADRTVDSLKPRGSWMVRLIRWMGQRNPNHQLRDVVFYIPLFRMGLPNHPGLVVYRISEIHPQYSIYSIIKH